MEYKVDHSITIFLWPYTAPNTVSRAVYIHQVCPPLFGFIALITARVKILEAGSTTFSNSQHRS